MTKLFFELIRVSLGSCSVLSSVPSAREWLILCRMAEKQTILGICFNGIQRLYKHQPEQVANLPLKLKMEWLGIAANIQSRNELVNRRSAELQKMLRQRGYRSTILKGQAAGALYDERLLSIERSDSPLRLLRQSGDIDIWIEGGREKVIELVQSIAHTNDIRETHAHLDVFHDVEVEAHYRPGLIRDFFRNNRLQVFFRQSAEKCFTNKVMIAEDLEIVAPRVEFHAVQQLLHVYHHLFDGGIGLRQIMDYYFVLRNLPEEKHGEVMAILSKLGVTRFVAALMYVLQEVFGLESDFILCPPDAKDGRYLLNEILEGGNFGFYDKRAIYRKHPSFFCSFFNTYLKNFRNMRFAPMEWLYSPMWRIYYFCWRKINGYK